jgi:hypothetical protein
MGAGTAKMPEDDFCGCLRLWCVSSVSSATCDIIGVCGRCLASLSQKVHDALLGGELHSPKLADTGAIITNNDLTTVSHF